MILVTGATGNVGSELVRQLAASGEAVRVLTRGHKDGALPATVQIARGDLDDPESLAPALEQLRAVFLLGGYRDMPGLLRQIQRAGIAQVVLLSSRSVVDGNRDNAIVRMWMKSEEAVRASDVPWTILRPSGFMSNALRWLPQLRAGDLVRAPFAGVPIAAVDPYDIAAVAAVTLTSAGHASRSYSLSGPQAMLPREQLRVLGSVLGRSLRFEGQPDAEARAEMSKSWPADMVDAFFRFYEEGEFNDAVVVPTVRELTGREPRTFEQWATAHIQDFSVTA